MCPGIQFWSLFLVGYLQDCWCRKMSRYRDAILFPVFWRVEGSLGGNTLSLCHLQLTGFACKNRKGQEVEMNSLYKLVAILWLSKQTPRIQPCKCGKGFLQPLNSRTTGPKFGRGASNNKMPYEGQRACTRIDKPEWRLAKFVSGHKRETDTKITSKRIIFD